MDTNAVNSSIFEHFYCFKQTLNKVGNKVWKKVGKKVLNSRKQKIILEMRNNPNITAVELHTILGVSEKAVKKNISFLKENGYRECGGEEDRVLESVIKITRSFLYKDGQNDSVAAVTVFLFVSNSTGR